MATSTKSKLINRYGFEWPEGTNDLNLELACYSRPEEFKTGQSTEFHFRKAFSICWPESVFAFNEWMELMMWAWCNYPVISVMGHASAGKTFGMAHFALLDYLAAPQSTGTFLVTTKFDMLKVRLFGDMMIGISNSRVKDAINATFRTTSSTNEMKFMLRGDVADQKFLIKGVALDRGDENASKLRGYHPPRHRIIADECQDMSEGIYMAMTNGLAAGNFKGVLLTNPAERQSTYGAWSQPKNGGWGSITDSTLWWENSRGVTLHLDGRQSQNVKAKKTVNPWMMSYEFFTGLHPDTVEYHMFGLGFFPPDGMIAKIWPSNTLDLAKRNEVFDFGATPCASLDPAFDSDECVFNLGVIGRLRNGRPCICAKKTFVIDAKVGPGYPEKDYQIARECIRLCKEHGVYQHNFIMDMTSNGRGVFAIMREEWPPLAGGGPIEGIYYGGEATDRPLRLDDALPAKEQVKLFVTELWFRASYLARDGMLCGVSNIDPKTVVDLDTRRYKKKTSEDKLMQAESKREMKARIGRSPDHGDSFCQFGELMVRKGLLGPRLGGQMRGSNWGKMREKQKRLQKRFVNEFSAHAE
jgi:hypothetical protein